MTKMILGWILSYRLGQLRYLLSKSYLGAISQTYKLASIIFGIIFFIGLFTSGIMLVAFGFSMVVSSTIEGRGIILLSIGGIAFVVSMTGYFILHSERVWIKFLNVDSVLKEISGRHSNLSQR